MFTFQIAQVPSFMNNTAGSALKRLSTAVGYKMTCYSQEKVTKQLPEYQSKQATHSLLERPTTESLSTPKISDSKQEVTLSETTPQKTAVLNKENIKPVDTGQSKLTAKPARAAGKLNKRAYYRHKDFVARKKNRHEILNKIRSGQTRRQSWRPDQILKNRGAKMSLAERKDLIEKADRLVTTGAIKAYDWLAWNVPKYSIKVMFLIMTGEIPEYANDAMKLCDLLRNLDRL